MQMTEIRHENIVPFIGGSDSHGEFFILTAYSSRGSLKDILQNQDFKLDNMFIASLVADLIKVTTRTLRDSCSIHSIHWNVLTGLLPC